MARIRIKDLKRPKSLTRPQLEQVRGGGRRKILGRITMHRRTFYSAW